MVNIALHMQRSGQKFAERTAVADGTEATWTYAELSARVSALAGGLVASKGLQPGERVGLIAKNCPEYLEILYACWHAGLVVVPINAKLHANEVAFILDHCSARICFASDGIAKMLATTAGSIDIIEIGGAPYQNLVRSQPIVLTAREADDPAWIFYTSGTTGKPKGATLSHRNLMTMTHCHLSDVDPVGPWTTLLHAAPMSHGSGLIALAYVMQGGCHVIPPSRGFDVAEVYDLLAAWPQVALFAAPTMVKRLTDHPEHRCTDNLKVIIYGGGPMYLEQCVAALDRFGGRLTQLYGQGESPMTITALSMAQHDRTGPRWRERLAGVGYPQSAVDVKVVDEQGLAIPVGEVGEIAVKGDTVMLGYWDDGRATADAIRDGWLHTGDLGAMNADGFLTLHDRSRDLIISGASNIYPREIEEILLRSDIVAEASVIGRVDAEWGETVVAYIVRRDESCAPAVAKAVLDRLCKNHIAAFKRPKDYVFVADLPKNSYGKILKKNLREWDRANC